MKRIDVVRAARISSMIFLRRSSNSPRYLVPATSEPMSSATRRLSSSVSGTSPVTIRCARPSTMAVLPTPGSPIRAGLFLVRRREDLDDALDLLLAADDRVELAGPRGVGQVDAELVEGRGLAGALGLLRRARRRALREDADDLVAGLSRVTPRLPARRRPRPRPRGRGRAAGARCRCSCGRGGGPRRWPVR